MQGSLIAGRERIEVRDFPEPQARPGAAVIAIERCGICGTDVSNWRSGEPDMLIGVSAGGVRLDPLACVTKAILLDNSTAHHHHEFRIPLDRMRDGRLRAAPIHSRTTGLGGLAGAYASLAAGREARVLVAPNG